MGTISVSLPSDGETIDAADYNTPITTIVNEINGNLNNANIVTGAAIATAKLASDAGIVAGMIADSAVTPAKLLTGTGSDWAWQSWTPTLSGRFDDAKWTKNCKYVQIGKTVHFRMQLTANAATPMAGGSTDAVFTLPITAVTYGATEMSFSIGTGGIYDASPGAIYPAFVLISSTTAARIRYITTGVNAITSTAPMTWTTSDEITVTGTYEAA